MRKEFGYSPTWLPNTRVAPGDVGVLVDDVFVHKTTLKGLGVSYDIVEDFQKASLEYNSAQAVSITHKGAGMASPPGSSLTEGEAGIIVQFTRKDAIVFEASECVIYRLADQQKVSEQLIGLQKSRAWHMSWVLVAEVVKAERATILISSGKLSQIELTLKSKVRVNERIALTSAGLSVLQERNVGTKIVSESHLTPLFRMMQLVKPFRKDARGRILRGGTASEPALAYVSYETIGGQRADSRPNLPADYIGPRALVDDEERV